MTFDEILIKILDFSPDRFNTARYALDFGYVIISSLILLSRWPSPMLNSGLIFSIMSLIIAVTATSIVRDDFRSNTDFLFATLRYVPIGAALATFNRSDVHDALRKAFSCIFIIQVIACIPQILQIEAFVQFLLPQQIEGLDTRIATNLDKWDGAIFGTFSENISLAFFLVFYIVFRKLECKSSWLSLDIILSCVLIYFTQSFAALFAVAGLALYWRSGWLGLLIAAVGGALGSTALVTFVYINGFSLEEYIRISETSRVGILLYTFPYYISDASFSEILVGIGRNVDMVRSVVFSARYVPEIFILSKNMAPLEDVYYIALFMYFGIFGFMSYVSIYLSCFMHIFRKDKEAGGAALAMTFVLAIATFVNQILSVQIVSASYWALVGLALARPAFMHEKQHG
ncbi:hypothetical protein LC607_33905 [Nostoc sp. CHAB 5824]|nr:hypothetical protein [Nostoc sp. CHAB 5824]